MWSDVFLCFTVSCLYKCVTEHLCHLWRWMLQVAGCHVFCLGKRRRSLKEKSLRSRLTDLQLERWVISISLGCCRQNWCSVKCWCCCLLVIVFNLSNLVVIMGHTSTGAWQSVWLDLENTILGTVADHSPIFCCLRSCSTSCCRVCHEQPHGCFQSFLGSLMLELVVCRFSVSNVAECCQLSGNDPLCLLWQTYGC